MADINWKITKVSIAEDGRYEVEGTLSDPTVNGGATPFATLAARFAPGTDQQGILNAMKPSADRLSQDYLAKKAADAAMLAEIGGLINSTGTLTY